jgi:hypothetical protein
LGGREDALPKVGRDFAADDFGQAAVDEAILQVVEREGRSWQSIRRGRRR